MHMHIFHIAQVSAQFSNRSTNFLEDAHKSLLWVFFLQGISNFGGCAADIHSLPRRQKINFFRAFDRPASHICTFANKWVSLKNACSKLTAVQKAFHFYTHSGTLFNQSRFCFYHDVRISVLPTCLWQFRWRQDSNQWFDRSDQIFFYKTWSWSSIEPICMGHLQIIFRLSLYWN